MDAFFPDPDAERLPSNQVRFLDLSAEPLPDGQRIRLHLQLTPFLESPVIELTLTNPRGEICGSTSIIEPAEWTIDLVLHIRTPGSDPGSHILDAGISYTNLGDIDHRQLQVDIPAPPKL